MKHKEVLGIDVGGSGIKGAPVDLKSGELTKERYRIPTPLPATPDAVVDVIAELVEHFKWKGPIGVGFPAVVQQGVVMTAANIDHSWIGVNVEKMINIKTKDSVRVVNDADAAGLAEMKFGGGKKNKGLVLLLTVGTGIGTVLFSKKKLTPNSELGHIIMPNGIEAEKYCSDGIRKQEELSWTEWGARFNEYLSYMEQLFWPDLIIIGGGVSKKMEKYGDQININTPVKPAKLLNEAGLIGAALSAKKMS